MNQKIEWYQEVLSIEPGSKVFFPLAKLLAADLRTAEAITILRQGLDRHPSYVEARIFLVELLFSQGEHAGLDEEIEKVTCLFSEHPNFWNAWSARLARTPEMQDASIALRFFCASMQGLPITWTTLMEQGLTAMLEPSATTSASFVHQANHTQEISPERMPERDVMRTPEHAPAHTLTHDPYAAPSFAKMPSIALSAEGDGQKERDDDDESEIFSLRTRSMADVLAEQGDISGAIDIYQELKNSASSYEASVLQQRIDGLHNRMVTQQPQKLVLAQAPKNIPEEENARLVLLLESLAQRLEARSR